MPAFRRLYSHEGADPELDVLAKLGSRTCLNLLDSYVFMKLFSKLKYHCSAQ